MMERGPSGFIPMEVILTQEKSSQRRGQAELLKIVNYTKFDAVITVTNVAEGPIGF